METRLLLDRAVFYVLLHVVILILGLIALQWARKSIREQTVHDYVKGWMPASRVQARIFAILHLVIGCVFLASSLCGLVRETTVWFELFQVLK